MHLTGNWHARRLPSELVSRHRTYASGLPDGVSSSRKILVVDDETSVLSALERLLTLERYDVVTAATAQEGLQRFQDHQFALALLDLNLPDQNGWELFQQIDSLAPSVPVVIITAQPDQHLHPLAKEVDGLMEKPLNLPGLLQTIESLIASSQPGPNGGNGARQDQVCNTTIVTDTE